MILGTSEDDILQSGEGKNTFYFRRGDGNDIIEDEDKVVIKDWHQTNNRIEAIKFADRYKIEKKAA